MEDAVAESSNVQESAEESQESVGVIQTAFNSFYAEQLTAFHNRLIIKLRNARLSRKEKQRIDDVFRPSDTPVTSSLKAWKGEIDDNVWEEYARLLVERQRRKDPTKDVFITAMVQIPPPTQALPEEHTLRGLLSGTSKMPDEIIIPFQVAKSSQSYCLVHVVKNKTIDVEKKKTIDVYYHLMYSNPTYGEPKPLRFYDVLLACLSKHDVFADQNVEINFVKWTETFGESLKKIYQGNVYKGYKPIKMLHLAALIDYFLVNESPDAHLVAINEDYNYKMAIYLQNGYIPF